SDRRSLTGASLAAETDESRDEVSRLKAGCSQDWLPHKRRINNPPQVGNLPHKAPGFLGVVGGLLMAAWALSAQSPSPDPVLRAMHDEIVRAKNLAIPNLEAPYFIQYV